ncbi:MAG: TraR/DksA C4-type zinc finger protein, partial [Patescibacteria group bacterium]
MEHYAAALRAEEADLEGQIEAFERQRRESLKDSVQELSSYDNHPGDLGNETFERSKDLALLDNARELKREVAEALRRIEDGTYGLCLHCGREIGAERLEAIPHARLCLDCRRLEEAWDPPRQRPIEEKVLHPPFGRSFRDNRTSVGYDGEDTWQDVARYGTSNTPSDMGGTGSYGEAFVDHNESRGLVEPVDGIIDVGPDEIPPAPRDAPE